MHYKKAHYILASRVFKNNQSKTNQLAIMEKKMFEMLGNLMGELEIPNAGEMSALCSHAQQYTAVQELQFHFLTNAEAQKYGLANKFPGFKIPTSPSPLQKFSRNEPKLSVKLQ